MPTSSPENTFGRADVLRGMLALDDLLRDRLGAPSPLIGRTVLTVSSPCLEDVEAFLAGFGVSVDRLCEGPLWTSVRVVGPRHVILALSGLARGCRGLPLMSPWARTA